MTGLTHDTSLNIHQRILKVMSELSYVAKGDKTVNDQYTFVSHDAVSAAVHPLLVVNGIIVIPRLTRWGKDTFQIDGYKPTDPPKTFHRVYAEMDFEFTNVDDPKDSFTVPSFGFGVDNSDKGPGKAMSYAAKYALLKTLMLETGDDAERSNPMELAARAETALEAGDWATLCSFNRIPEYKEAWKLLGTKMRGDIRDLEKKRDAYRDGIKQQVFADDAGGVVELWAELTVDEKACVFETLTEGEQAYIREKREA